MTGLKLPKHKNISMNKLKLYSTPKEVFIPNIDKDSCKYKLNDKVLKGDLLGYNSKFNTPIFSSVSGKIIDFKDVKIQNGDIVSSVVIENDEKEKNNFIERDISKITKEEFITILKENGIVGMGGAGFPTHMKYDTDKKINTLIVNSVECEPYITSDYTLFMEHTTEILDTISNILRINDIDEAIVCIKKYNKKLIDKVNNLISNYKNIKLETLPDRYPYGWERALIKKVLNVSYDKLPIEKGIVVNNVSTIYQIGLSLNNNIPLIERIITITGNGIKKPCNILVKNGTKIKEILDKLGMYKNAKIIANGPMMGTLVDDSIVVTSTLNCVLVLKDEKEIIENECLRCGKCSNVCPSMLTPVLIKDKIRNKEELKKLHPEKCISCGLCSYICPSKIDVRSYVSKAKEVIK